MERLGYSKDMAEGSQAPEEKRYIPKATERSTNATPLSEWGDRKPQFRGAIPQEEYEKMTRRKAIEKGILTIGGLAAAAAGLFGLGKAFEKAWASKEPSIEAGKEKGAQAGSTGKKERDIGATLPGNTPPQPEGAKAPTPPLWERTAVPAGQEPTPQPKIDPTTIKRT